MNRSCATRGRYSGATSGGFTTARIENPVGADAIPLRRSLLALWLSLSFTAAASAGDYAGAISACRHAHGLSAVKSDSRLGAVALTQARAMASTGSVSHRAAGNFAVRVAALRKSRAAENIGAGFVTFSEMLKQWEASAGHRQNLLMAGARRVGVAAVDNPKSPYRKFWAMVITD